MSESDTKNGGGTIYDEIELILSEKRTALSTLRTGIAVFALPLSVLSVLVATSSYYTISAKPARCYFRCWRSAPPWCYWVCIW